MKFSKTLLYLLAICSLTSPPACRQHNKMTAYKGDKFTLEYPAEWQTTNENGILNFISNDNKGALTLSYHSGIDFPLEMTKEFILDMNEIKDNPSNVKMTKKGDITEFYYEHIDKDIKWVTKAFRRDADFYLITINCDLNNWALHKDIFMTTLNSFKLL